MRSEALLKRVYSSKLRLFFIISRGRWNLANPFSDDRNSPKARCLSHTLRTAFATPLARLDAQLINQGLGIP
jgi:hypothetical protein